jgi:hypothetical protein
LAEQNPLTALDAQIAATRRKLTLLELGRAFWPLYVLVFLFLAFAFAGIFERGAASVAALLTLFSLVGGVILAVRGVRAFRRVSREEAVEALDRQSDLRPVSSLSDRPADTDPETYALWSRHRDRLLSAIKSLRPPSLKAGWKALDPFLMRAILPSAVACLAIIAGSQALPRLQHALQPDLGALMGADDMVVEAWITPPDHTGRAPIFLKPGLQGVRVPKGSEVTLRTQARSAPKLILKGEKTRKQRFDATPDGAYEAKAILTEDTRVAVNWWGERQAWSILASPDDAPNVQFVSMPFMGAQDRTEFTWAADDDYGVKRLELAIRLKEPNPLAPEAEDRVPVPLPGVDMKEASDTTQLDMTRHRWAGLMVDVQLVATDGAGQDGRSETIPFILPEKLFLEPMARAAQEVRVTVLREPADYGELPANLNAVKAGAINTASMNRLEAAPGEVKRAALMLDALTLDGHKYIDDRSLYLALRMAHGILKAADSKAEADEIDTLLWAAALKAEYGSAADALRRLMAARRALEQALRDGASEEEIKRRMEAFKDAANDYLAAKMAEAIANGMDSPQSGEDMAGGGDGPSLGGQDFEDMLEALQDLTETGATDQARQLLSDITNMLENLEFEQGNGSGEGMPGMPGENAENGEGDMPEEEREMTEAMKRLSDILREQRELNDDTLAQERGETPGEQSGQQGEQGQQGQPLPGEQGQPGETGEQGQPGETGESGQGQTPDPQGETGEGQGEGEEGEDGAGSGEGEQAENGEGAGAENAQTLAERQAELGRLVDEFARENGLAEGAGENALAGRIDDEALDEIRRAQRRAADALEQGNERRAARNQEQATQLLSGVSRELASDLDELREARTGEGGQDGSLDPLGRPTTGAANSGEDVNIPDASERQQAKEVLEELRRRYSEAEDEEEREYLERLLDRF